MSIATTILHAQGQSPEAIERAFDAIFAREERAQVLRLEGSYSAVLARALDEHLAADARYLILHAHPSSDWTPIVELGSRIEGLDGALSKALGGCAIFTLYAYGDAVSGYWLTRQGIEVDRYASDPSYFDEDAGESDAVGEESQAERSVQIEALRGRPERFVDLLPQGTLPEDFSRIVLQPGWWEERMTSQDDPDLIVAANDANARHIRGQFNVDDDIELDEIDVVDETDRMRCIALALELWGPTDYPFTQELEDIPNKLLGPALLLAFA